MKVNEAQELLRAKLEGETTERKRLAADLHDGVSNDLAAIKVFLSVITTTNDESKRREIYHDLRNEIDKVVETTRQISYTLMPPLIESRGLPAALADNFERLKKRSNKNFTLSTHDNPVMPPSIAYEIFRVIQEFSTNFLKHGNATKFHVDISSREKDVFIDIQDNGAAFSFEEQMINSQGAGLRNITSRLKMINCTFRQEPNDDGNQFTIIVPRQ